MNDKLEPEDFDTSEDETQVPKYSSERTVFHHAHAAGDRTSVNQVRKQSRDDNTRTRAANRNPSGNSLRHRNSDATGVKGARIAGDATRIRSNPNANQRPVAHHASEGSTRVRNTARYQNNNALPAGDSQHRQKQILKGRFTLEKVIGVGGMGVVYKATDRLKVEARDREPYVAIKVLSEEFKTHPESFIALQRESRKTQRIAHPNVVKVYDFDRDGDTVFMTMEYMAGVPLDQLIKQYSVTGLPRDDAWSILKGLCSALMYAHAEKIVHSDFKPGNIFITDAGIPKIFDFGIARAVANIDRHSGKQKDRTVFDAGSLGALTPAYASLEMLQGKDPDTRDDVYALGCIAYEMLTGEHPFNRIPADEACKRRLKPKKIPNLKKSQWRAIEKALAFKREDRVKSVDDFYHQIQPKTKSISILFSTIVVLAAIGGATYLILTRETPVSGVNRQQVDKDKIEFQVRYDFYKEKLTKLIASPAFTEDWEISVWDEYSGMSALLNGKPDTWLSQAKNTIYRLYMAHYREALGKRHYQLAKHLLTNTYRYADDTSVLDVEQSKLAELISKNKERESALAERNLRYEDRKLSKAKKNQSDNYYFGLALKNVNQQLECQSRLNMREFGIAINKLKTVDIKRYSKMEPSFISTLVGCITHIAKSHPEMAMEEKRYALRIFNNNQLISAIQITPRDACNMSIAGLGSRGERAVCRDRIKGTNEDGPAMVVVPGSGSVKAFAISKYEVSQKDINVFCRMSSACSPSRGIDSGLPAVNIGISTISQYLRWLSMETKHKYRLPTRKEWVYAATASRAFVDPNRNCSLNSRGIEKGGQLVKSNTGVQNGWGLVNYLGNAQELVYDKSRNLLAMGGSFRNSMDDCSINSHVNSTGTPDSTTGFRVIREVSR